MILDQGFEDNRGYRSIDAIFVCFCVLLGFVNVCCGCALLVLRCCALLCFAVLGYALLWYAVLAERVVFILDLVPPVLS